MSLASVLVIGIAIVWMVSIVVGFAWRWLVRREVYDADTFEGDI